MLNGYNYTLLQKYFKKITDERRGELRFQENIRLFRAFNSEIVRWMRLQGRVSKIKREGDKVFSCVDVTYNRAAEFFPLSRTFPPRALPIRFGNMNLAFSVTSFIGESMQP